MDTEIGANIQRIRKQKGLTQRELAEKCCVATGTIQRYELGTRNANLHVLKKIANSLDTDIANILGISAPTSPDTFISEQNININTKKAISLLKKALKILESSQDSQNP
jgi:transcriptional regulator with XRE-family HTH domain